MHPEDESDGRVRRKTALPARYADYDLTGFAQPTLTTEPMSPHTQIPSHLSDDENQEEGATAYDLPLITVDELHSSDEWSTSDSGRSETALLKKRNRNLHYENDNMLHTVQVMQKERDADESALCSRTLTTKVADAAASDSSQSNTICGSAPTSINHTHTITTSY